MFEDLIEYKDLYEACEECFGFGGVTFKRDFGPWKKGEQVSGLWFRLENKAVVEEISDEGVVIRSCKFQLTAV